MQIDNKCKKHKKNKTCKKSNEIKNCTFAPAISTSYLFIKYLVCRVYVKQLREVGNWVEWG